MKQKKIKTLITLLNARERTKRALKRYDELYSKQALNLTFQSEIQDTLNYFKINLYNYIRAIKDKKEYFDNAIKTAFYTEDQPLQKEAERKAQGQFPQE